MIISQLKFISNQNYSRAKEKTHLQIIDLQMDFNYILNEY